MKRRAANLFGGVPKAKKTVKNVLRRLDLGLLSSIIFLNDM